MRKVITIAALAALALPATAFAQAPAPKNAAYWCKAQRTAMGETMFKQTYGTNADRSNAYGRCVAKQSRAVAEARESASADCRSERESLGETAFNQKYGKNENDRNAFGKCVSKLTRAEQANRTSAAQQCRAEQNDPNFAASHGGKTFEQFYGSGQSGKNAFGKCVSAKAKALSQAQQQRTLNAAKQCKAERAADPAAFKARYGSNSSKANAFGKCVSMKARSR